MSKAPHDGGASKGYRSQPSQLAIRIRHRGERGRPMPKYLLPVDQTRHWLVSGDRRFRMLSHPVRYGSGFPYRSLLLKARRAAKAARHLRNTFRRIRPVIQRFPTISGCGK